MFNAHLQKYNIFFDIATLLAELILVFADINDWGDATPDKSSRVVEF